MNDTTTAQAGLHQICQLGQQVFLLQENQHLNAFVHQLEVLNPPALLSTITP